jgi:putative ABC transport system permease protein
LTTYSVPAGRIVLILALSFAIGVAAAIIPARRATKLDVLAAIASE